MNLVEFFDVMVDEDRKKFIDEVYKVMAITGVSLDKKTKLIAYQCKGIAREWYH